MNPPTVRKWNARQIGKIVMQCSLVISTGLAIFLFELFINPYERGFFCEDVNLKYPLKTNIYPGWTLVVIIFVPVVVMILTESTIFNWSPKAVGVQIYKHFGIYIFGFFLHFLILDYIKHFAGRLRPCFFDICRPIMADGSDCSSPENQGIYIMNYTCSNPYLTKTSMKDFRVSFPSAHASVTFYAMTYLVLYIHSRWNTCKLFKFLLEFLCLMFAVSVAVSRVSDYSHFWSDVCAGSLLGMVFAGVVVRFLSDLYKRKNIDDNFKNEIKYVGGV